MWWGGVGSGGVQLEVMRCMWWGGVGSSGAWGVVVSVGV